MSKANKITDQETVKLKFSLPPKLYRQLQLVDGVDSDQMSAIVERALAYVLGNADDVEASDSQNQRIYTCEDYDKLLESNPSDYKAWYGRGVVLKNIGRYEEAIASLDKALEIKPDYYKAWYARGNALYGLDFYEEAIASYDKAVDLQPEYAEAWYYRGKALDELGSYEEAIASYDTVLKIKPDDQYTVYSRSIALQKLGRIAPQKSGGLKSKQKVTLYLSPELHKRLKVRSAIDSQPMSDLAERALGFYLANSELVQEVESSIERTHRVYSCPNSESSLVLRDGELLTLANQPGVIGSEHLPIDDEMRMREDINSVEYRFT